MRLSERILLIGSGEPDWAPTDPLDSQVYLVETPDGHVIVDAGLGASVPTMVEAARHDGVDPERVVWILLTHGHADHAGGAAAWRRSLPNVRIAASPDVAGWLAAGDETAMSVDRARRAGIYPSTYHLEACEPDHELVAGSPFVVGDLTFEVVPTPGHALGHLSFMVELDGVRTLFSGDALFPHGRILLQDTWDCDLHDALRSVERLAAMAPHRLLAGHLRPVLDDARPHFDAAMARIARLLLPDPLS